jgi:hypothetical protein
VGRKKATWSQLNQRLLNGCSIWKGFWFFDLSSLFFVRFGWNKIK